jgi:hypothetical protein
LLKGLQEASEETSVKKHKPFDRYDYYTKAVQSPEVDVEFMQKAYRELRGRKPKVFREDFCGTFALCCEWARKNKEHRSIGIDLDPEPIAYGTKNYLSQLKPEQRKRVSIKRASVLTASGPKADIVAAFNFSFYIFKTRKMLLKYFKQARKNLKKGGLFMVDCFGGKDCQEANVEKTRIGHFTYYWDQMNFDALRNEAVFHIHFKRKGERLRSKVFTYDWRIWSIIEIRELMMEAGFKKTHVYWEGFDKKGEGNGIFTRTEEGDEESDGWVAYGVGEN